MLLLRNDMKQSSEADNDLLQKIKGLGWAFLCSHTSQSACQLSKLKVLMQNPCFSDGDSSLAKHSSELTEVKILSASL